MTKKKKYYSITLNDFKCTLYHLRYFENTYQKIDYVNFRFGDSKVLKNFFFLIIIFGFSKRIFRI